MSDTFETAEAPDIRRPKRNRPPITTDRLPPHSMEAEQACLGCMLLAPSPCIDECVVRFSVNGEQMFYDLRHQTIYNAMVAMSLKGEEIDVITLMQNLKDRQLLEQVGGLTYLSSLPDATPSAANIDEYLAILEKKFKLRKMLQICTKVVGSIYDSEGEVEELLDQAERDVLSVRMTSSRASAQQIRGPIQRAIQTIDDYHQRSGMLLGIPTGFSDLDKMTGGLVDSQMYVIAGRPSLGKTSLCMNIAEHVALESKLPVGVFSLEMTTDSLVLRMLCSRSRVNIRNVSDGFLADRDFPKITGAAGKLAPSPIWIDDSSGLSIMDLRARARRMVASFGIKLFVIDYLQLLMALINGKRIDKREREVSEVSAGIKALAKELKVPIIAISQLNRTMDREKRKPVLADLRESGSLEQDADLVGLLYRAKVSDDDDAHSSDDAIGVNLLIAKQREGPAGEDVHLTFLKKYTRFESASKVSEDDVNQRDFAYKR